MISASEQMGTTEPSYNLSFTSGDLLVARTLIVAEEYLKTNNWDATIKSVESQNLLQARTASTSKRILREVCSRLKLLTEIQLGLLQGGSRSDQQQLLWLAVCKRYKVLYDFSSEVVRNKYLHLDLAVTGTDFDNFLEAKSIWHAEIDNLAASTRAKLRQVAFRMLREADIVSKENVIQPTILSAEMVQAIRSDSVAHFTIFPVSETDVRGALE